MRLIHLKYGTAFGVDSSVASSGEEIDLSAPYATWFDSLVSGALLHISYAPPHSTNAAPACVSQGFTSGLAVTNAETVGTIGADDMMVPQAIQTYGVDGSGIRIGILSDSFNLHGGEAADIAAGLLPADGVTILKEGPFGSDEGRAMAELIHEVAPGAQIDFYSAFWSETDFASGIRALAQAGCNIIVDDVTYLDEPFFQDGGAVQAAVEAVTAEGVSYFTSASDEGNNFYQANFTPVSVTLPGGVAGGSPVTAQQFSNGTALQSLTIAGGDTVTFSLQWDQPFATIGTGRSSASSLALYLFDSAGKLVASAVDDTVGGNPVQILPFTNNGATANFSLAIVLNDGVAPGLLKYIVYSDQTGAITINDANAGIGSGSVIGHEMISAANTVGAVNANDGTNPPTLEPFSSVGPGDILFDASGDRLAQPIDPNKINFTAPDGIATSVLNPFFGTSAAASNAAAVAALMLQANPKLTPAQVTDDLAKSALVTNGGSNAADGAGFIQAPGAVQAALAALCYCRGTRIATPSGEAAIETLREGDCVLTLSDGELNAQPVKWVGRRRLERASHPRPESVAPVRIQRGAFASSMPHNDLVVSPDHAIFVDGKLICARQLVNGTTIRQERGWTAVDYYHVELDTHAILLAEGLPAESYLDTGNRGFFANSDVPLVLHPDLTDETDYPMREAGSCAPFVSDEASVRPVWQRLADRAAALGLPVSQPATTMDPDLRLRSRQSQPAKGTPVHQDDNLVIFVVPRGSREIRLISRAQAPTETRPWLDDRRKLGVRVKRIVLRGANDLREIPMDHPNLTKGWWDIERDEHSMSRWTDGDAVVPLPMMNGPVMLELHLAGKMIYVLEAASEVSVARTPIASTIV